MIELNIPDYGLLKIKYFVMDYNGTLALNGRLSSRVKELLNKLAKSVEIHIITADTFGKAKAELEGVKCTLKILPEENQREEKKKYIHQLGKDYCVAFGNGRNDALMMKSARLGIGIIGGEGAFTETILNSDLMFKSIEEALLSFVNTKRLIASLRS